MLQIRNMTGGPRAANPPAPFHLNQGTIMTYRTVLVQVDATPQSIERTRVAAQLAAAFEAHLVGVASTGLSDACLLAANYGEAMVDLTPLLAQRREAGVHALAQFDSAAERHGASSRETRLVDDETGIALCLHAPYSDLLVMGQTDIGTVNPFESADVPQYAALHAGRPVLIVPHAGAPAMLPRRILVAWDASPAATRAVTDSLPLLRRAASVEILGFTEAHPDERQGQQPATDLAQYLARHGVNVLVSAVAATSHQEVGAALLAHAGRTQADLLVMGCYGHSRLRELMLGGTTRSVLDEMAIPVLMSH
jgi:nucleotide-binding universal stress UspA family protein